VQGKGKQRSIQQQLNTVLNDYHITQTIINDKHYLEMRASSTVTTSNPIPIKILEELLQGNGPKTGDIAKMFIDRYKKSKKTEVDKDNLRKLLGTTDSTTTHATYRIPSNLDQDSILATINNIMTLYTATHGTTQNVNSAKLENSLRNILLSEQQLSTSVLKGIAVPTVRFHRKVGTPLYPEPLMS
jgi:hypothetical protein